ncbi:ABC transporter permease [Halothermothrix orenii]|uniref:ABC-2 type transporter n=1 Tax=Halothermothrix orenii (strain H 168 / OCM 544 / DSM 9562) TaxID=373903 RepID=B8D1Q3_HALOH|nr:ABC transporter permease [Halothermothrix orenii]ACL69130.1 ABC-2 type transporter [Halothermothrix orenii H 168]
MFKKIINLIKKDLINGLRNNMVIYMLLFPLVLALGMSFFIPSVTEVEVTIAVDSGVDQWVINRLEDYGKVELYDSPEAVKERVKRLDDISGIIKDEDEYVVLIEGNEPEETVDMARAVMNMVLSDEQPADFKYKSLNKETSMMQEVMGSILMLTAILVSGLVIGMNIIDEKETGVINALTVSPLKLRDFIISHTTVALISGIIISVLSLLILVGTSINYIQVILGTICTMGIGIAWGFLIGGIADNLMSGIAVIKGTMLFLIGIPIGSIFVPANFRWILYPFPNYWAFQVYRNILNGGKQWVSFSSSAWITLAFGLILLLALSPMLKKRLNLK